MDKVLADKVVQHRLKRLGMDLGSKSLEQLGQPLADDNVATQTLVKLTGAAVD